MRKILLALAFAALPSSAFAFSAPGHQLIATLAYERLTPAAKADVNALLASSVGQDTPQCPAQTVAQASTWADCVRGIPEYAGMKHTESIPLCPYKREKGCPDGRCLSVGTEDAIATLKNSTGVTPQRLQALEIVIHFIGDMHQPLHTVGAYGSTGTSVPVDYPGAAAGDLSLHKIWDNQLVTVALQQGGVPAIKSLMAQNAQTWSSGSVSDWINESHEIGVRYGYGPLGLDGCGRQAPANIQITQSYINQAAAIERQQIAKAAVRLADVLNETLH